MHKNKQSISNFLKACLILTIALMSNSAFAILPVEVNAGFNPSVVPAGESTTLNWASGPNTECKLISSSGTLNVAGIGSKIYTPNSDLDITVKCNEIGRLWNFESINVIFRVSPAFTSSTGTNHFVGSGFENSGAVYDASITAKIFMVSDNKKIASMNTDGSNPVVSSEVLGKDLEAIASSGDGFLYVGLEGGSKCWQGICVLKKKAKIVERDAATLLKTGRSWKLDDLSVKGTSGMEGLTWVPNGSHPYGTRPTGGVFYASSQRNGKIYVYEINRNFDGDTVSPVLLHSGFIPLAGEDDISDLYFSPDHEILYVLYDELDQVVAIDISTIYNKKLAIYNLPASPIDQEGITLLPGSCSSTTTIYLTDDGGDGARPGDVFSFAAFQGVCQ
ncbi:MAG: hypothetical protein L3J46_02460 [Kangiellaceae bacterium]|nr:hypothetical protein [Kangiellaceae bacterium]